MSVNLNHLLLNSSLRSCSKYQDSYKNLYHVSSSANSLYVRKLIAAARIKQNLSLIVYVHKHIVYVHTNTSCTYTLEFVFMCIQLDSVFMHAAGPNLWNNLPYQVRHAISYWTLSIAQNSPFSDLLFYWGMLLKILHLFCYDDWCLLSWKPCRNIFCLKIFLENLESPWQ